MAKEPRIIKVGIIALEVAGLCLAICATLFGYALWRVEHGTLPLDGLRPSVSLAINKSLPQGYRSTIEGMSLRSNGTDRNTYQLVLNDINITYPDGTSAGQSAELILSIEKKNIFLGRFGVSGITATDSSLVIKVPSSQQKSDSKRDQVAVNQQPNHFLSNLFNSSQFRTYLRKTDVDGLNITFSDIGTGRSWVARNVRVDLNKNDGASFTLDAHAELDVEAERSKVDLTLSYDENIEVASVSLAGRDMPVGDLAAFFSKLPAGAYTAPISGSVDLSIMPDGKILDADFNITSGNGVLTIAGDEMPVRTLKVVGLFDSDTGDIELKEFLFSIGENKGALTGRIGYGPIGLSDDYTSNKSELNPTIKFDLAGQDLVFNPKDVFPTAIKLDKIIARGRYEFTARVLALERLDLFTEEVGISGDLIFQQPQGVDGKANPSFGLIANMETDGKVSQNQLIEFWPVKLAPRSRQWIKTRVKTGYVENIDFRMNLPAGLRGEIGYIPDDNLELEFDVSQASVEFIRGLTPLTKAKGHGLLKGNSLKVDVTDARLGSVQVVKGQVEFPEFKSEVDGLQDGGHIYRFTGFGEAGEMLGFLDEQPLGLITRSGLKPAQISGNASVDMIITRPAINVNSQRSQQGGGFEYDGKIKFNTLTFSEIFRDLDLENAEGEIDLKTRGMTITGNADLDLTPVEIVWNQRFYEEDGLSDFSVSGIFDAAMADSLGFATRSFLRGPVKFSLNAIGGYQQLEKFHIDANFKDASLGFPQFGLYKKTGSSAVAVIDAIIADDGFVTLNNLAIEGDDIDISGNMSFEKSGRLSGFAFSRFFIEDRADFSAEAQRGESGALDLSLSGSFLDLGPAIAGAVGAQSTVGNQQESPPSEKFGEFDWGDGVRASLRLDRLGLRSDVQLRDTALDFWHDASEVQILNLSGLDNDLDTIRVFMSHNQGQEGPERAIEAETTDLGTLFEGMFGITSIKGGVGTLHIELGNATSPAMTGNANAQNLRVIEAPLLAKLFAAGSFDGLSDLLNDEGIALDRASTEFIVEDGKVHLFDTRAIGPSIGITANGNVGLSGRGDIVLNGALAPAYQVNSFLGKIPLVGGLLVNREGEGVVALTYNIAGNVVAPTVTINPLTVLAPGMLRRAFENNEAIDDDDLLLPERPD